MKKALALFLALVCGGVAASTSWLGNHEGMAWGSDPADLGLMSSFADSLDDGEGSGRRLLAATSFIQVLQTDAQGVKIIQGSVVATGYENDEFCQAEASICVQTQPCRRRAARRSLLQNRDNVGGAINIRSYQVTAAYVLTQAFQAQGLAITVRPDDVTVDQTDINRFTASVPIPPALGGGQISVGGNLGTSAINTECTTACSPAVEQNLPQETPLTLVLPPGSNVVVYNKRRRSLLAADPTTMVTGSSYAVAPGSQGNEFTYTTTLTFKGQDTTAQGGVNNLAGAFNTGVMDICQGYSFVSGGSNPKPVDPIKPVQRYQATVGVGTRGASCQDFSNRRGLRAYRQCAASLTGQPNAFLSIRCEVTGNPNRKRKTLTILIAVRKSGTAAQGQALLASLVNDVGSGAFETCVRSQGLSRYLPRGVRFQSLDIPNPRLPS